MARINRNAEETVVRQIMRSLRQESGLTQSDLAALLDVPQSFISKYESGERRLDVLEARRICAALGLSFEQFARRLDSELSTP